jgi:Ankyrin repeats (3 copies)
MTNDIANMSMVAVIWGQLPVLKWMHQSGYRLHRDTIKHAANRGDLPMVQWLYQAIGQSIIGLIDDVGGNLELAKWLHTKDNIISKQTLVSAATGGYLDILKWLHTEGQDTNVVQVHAAAACNGHISVVKWLYENGSQMSDCTLINAAGSGELDLIKWLISIGCQWTEECFRTAARRGRINIIEWGLDSGYTMNVARVETSAVHNGQTEVLDWLRKNIHALSADICAKAARVGNLEIIQWLCGEGYPWDEKNNIMVIKSGEHDTLDWILANGYPCNLEEYAIIATNYLWDPILILECLKDHGLDVDSPLLQKHVISSGFTDVIQWMQKHGASLDVAASDDTTNDRNEGW